MQPQPVMAVDEPKTTPPPQWTEPNKSVPLVGFSRETSPALPVGALKQPDPTMAETVASRFAHHHSAETRTDEIPNDLAVTRKQEPEKDLQTVIETRPQAIAESVTEVAHRILMETASPELVNLTYACLIIPRFDNHLLVGDVADRLTSWVPQVCIAFGWRLEHLAVRPDYLQWVVRVPPTTAPGYIMRLVRQQTSERLFKEFPKFREENIGGDFWAPGYLIMGRSQPHPQQFVRDFIRQTRDRQGITR
jgi:REP element-mobilizing transposase RayT